MPFTLSHPAAVLPLRRLGLPVAALVVGSMSPDFPYYTPFRMPTSASHSPIGVVTVDLAMSIVVWVVWQFGLREPLADLAPQRLRERLPAHLRRSPPWPGRADLAPLALAMVLGAATHVAWDSFTHRGRNLVRHVAFLSEMHGPLPGYKWAQHLSTVLGLAVLTWAAHRALAAVPPVPTPRRVPELTRMYSSSVLAAAAIGGLGGRFLRLPDSGASPGAVAFAVVTSAGASVIGVTVVIALWWHLRVRGGPSTGSPPPGAAEVGSVAPDGRQVE